MNVLLQIVKSLSYMLEDGYFPPIVLHSFIFLIEAEKLDEVSSYFENYTFTSTTNGPHSDQLRTDISILYARGEMALIEKDKLVPTKYGTDRLKELAENPAFLELKKKINHFIVEIPSCQEMNERMRKIKEYIEAKLGDTILI